MFKKVLAFLMTTVILFTALQFQLVIAETSKDIQVVQKTNDAELQNYENYLASHINKAKATENIVIPTNSVVDSAPISVVVNVPIDGLYTVGMTYRALGQQTTNLEVKIKIDSQFPFNEFELLKFPKYWVDEKGKFKLDGQGNEIPKGIVPCEDFQTEYAIDITGWTNNPYLVYFSSGEHIIEIETLSNPFELKALNLGYVKESESYKRPDNPKEYYDGQAIIIEGENPVLKNSYWLSSKSDDASADVYPSSPLSSKINYIGGNWKNVGETIVWETPELKAGYYKIGFSFRQETLIGSSSYRLLKIDGEMPFRECKQIAFPYKSGWQKQFYEDSNGNPYLIYFDEGKHKIELSVTLGELTDVCDLINESITILGDLYMDITMITGETVDIYRDYDLFTQIPDMESRLNTVIALLKDAKNKLKNISGATSGSYTSVIDNMNHVIEKMLTNKYTAHRYKNNFYSNYCNISSTLNEMKNMPLEIDQIYLAAYDDKEIEETSFFKKCSFSILRFISSFTTDYNNVSSDSIDNDSIEIWVNWGRDQAQILSTLSQNFSEETGISVNIRVTNASMVQAVLSGKGPNVFLHSSRAEPVNLAMRNVLCDLSEFEDCDNILERFQDGAEIPYRYKNGLYALPDTQTFYMMYYRTDIFEKLGLKVPETWEEFTKVSKLLSRNNLDVWMPYTQITDMNQVNTGIGSLSLFPSLVMQSGLSLYSDDGKSTTLTNTETIKVFTNWTDYYTKMKLPITLNFYNRFRIGTCPLGIDSYMLYNTLKAAAPEIDGKWAMTIIPGTVQQDGTVVHTSSGGGSGCGILKSTSAKESLSWEYLKWWTSAEIQTAYSNNVESVLGPTGRVAVSNVEAMFGFAWDIHSRKEIVDAWKQVQEVKEVPGSYYLARAIDHSFWSVANKGAVPKDMMYKWGKEVDGEINRKWNQYENRDN